MRAMRSGHLQPSTGYDAGKLWMVIVIQTDSQEEHLRCRHLGQSSIGARCDANTSVH